MSYFREIIPLEQDYHVAQAKAMIAVKTVTWVSELELYLRRVKRDG